MTFISCLLTGAIFSEAARDEDRDERGGATAK